MSLKVFWAIVIGTLLEYFDFLLFAHFSLIIAPLFFPDSDPIVSAIQALGLFAVGFFMRPLGAIIFGRIGDSKGRKPALSASVLWAALPTLTICFLPTYGVIGIFAPIILILCRMAQGLSLGGEYTNAGVLLMEHTPPEKRGFYSSILSIAGTSGSTAALFCAFIILRPDMPSWAWRVPFFLGSIAGLIGYKMRKILAESPEFSVIQNRHDVPSFFSWKQILKDKKPFLITIAIGALVGVLLWTPVTYTNFYLTKIMEWNASDSALMTFLATMTYIAVLPFAGILCDRIGARTIMLRSALIAAFLSYPLFLCLTHGFVAITQIGFASLVGFFGAAIHHVMIDLYPVHKRCRAISLGFSLGLAIFGGTSPMIAAWLVDVTGDHTAPALYISIVSIAGALAMYSYPLFKIRDKNNAPPNFQRNLKMDFHLEDIKKEELLDIKKAQRAK
ncbi:MAG: MFS transporter [Alphaproteobacteria bacterium]|nr:MFS transporter [Alphaproteobacteria bacterium]